MLNDQVIADNHTLIARNRELECELARCKARLGAAACSGDSGMRDRLVAEATRLLDLARDMGAGEGDGE